MLSQSSTRLHVRVIIIIHGSVSSVASVYVASKSVEQLSASSVTSPVRIRSVGSCSQLIVTSAGIVNVGGVSGATVKVEVQLSSPQISVTL